MTGSKVCLLAIESSCDDTAAAIIANGEVLSNVVAGQLVHEEYGGVVPEAASRAHQVHIVATVDTALKEAGISVEELDGIAFTQGPGLIGSLLVGISFAKGLALSKDLPLIAVHHLHAHLMAHFAEPPFPKFPFLCLTVSGGHTQIVRVDNFQSLTVLGSTLDDAAGEAFDKTGKMLGLPYPAGPHIDRLAKTGTARYPFTIPAIDGLNFSFSGLKTGVLRFLQKERKKDIDFIEKNLPDIAASIQETIVQILMQKLIRASEETNIRQIAIAGGVSANSGLRQRLSDIGKERDWEIFIPKLAYCTDNAAMIGIAGYYQFLAGDIAEQTITAMPRMKL